MWYISFYKLQLIRKWKCYGQFVFQQIFLLAHFVFLSYISSDGFNSAGFSKKRLKGRIAHLNPMSTVANNFTNTVINSQKAFTHPQTKQKKNKK